MWTDSTVVEDGKERVFSLDTENNDLFTSVGVPLGYDEMDGNLPGGNEYSGYVTFCVKAQFAAINPEVSEKSNNTILRSVVQSNAGYGTVEDTADVYVNGRGDGGE